MRLSRRSLVAPLLALALGAIGGLPGAAVAQQAVTVQLQPQSGSGISGTATLTAMGNQTRVVVNVTGAGAGPQPAHIHEGTCANLNPAPKYPLTSVMNGTSETVVNAPLSELQATPMAINLHKSPQEVPVYVACGNIPLAAARAAAQPAQLPRTGEAGFLPYGLAVLGGALALAGTLLAIRRRAI